MRELSRFRGEFLENFSLRSKLLNILKVQERVEKVMSEQGDVLQEEIEKLDEFFIESQKLFESKVVDLIAKIRRAKTQANLGKTQAN